MPQETWACIGTVDVPVKKRAAIQESAERPTIGTSGDLGNAAWTGDNPPTELRPPRQPAARADCASRSYSSCSAELRSNDTAPEVIVITSVDSRLPKLSHWDRVANTSTAFGVRTFDIQWVWA